LQERSVPSATGKSLSAKPGPDNGRSTGEQGLVDAPLIVNGEHDNALPGGQRTAALIPHAVHEILPRTGHCCFLEDPENFNALVQAFLVNNKLWPPA
jgi:pimeloyl-ACP methyl ester carboxylesterase